MSLGSDEITEIRRRLEEAEATLLAIREGQVDALVVAGADGESAVWGSYFGTVTRTRTR